MLIAFINRSLVPVYLRQLSKKWVSSSTIFILASLQNLSILGTRFLLCLPLPTSSIWSLSLSLLKHRVNLESFTFIRYVVTPFFFLNLLYSSSLLLFVKVNSRCLLHNAFKNDLVSHFVLFIRDSFQPITFFVLKHHCILLRYRKKLFQGLDSSVFNA